MLNRCYRAQSLARMSPLKPSIKLFPFLLDFLKPKLKKKSKNELILVMHGAGFKG